MTKSSIVQNLYNSGKRYLKSTVSYLEIYSNLSQRNNVTNISSFLKNIRQAFVIKNKLDNSLFRSDKINHINLDKTHLPDNYRGKFFIRQEKSQYSNGSSLRETRDGEVENAKILAIGGLDFDTPMHISALLRFTKNLAAKSKDILPDAGNIAIFPEVSREERYAAAIKFSEDKTFYPKYIEDRVRKYFIPRIMDEDTMFDIPISYSIVSFSVGGREVLMMENALRNILKDERGLNKETIDKFLSYCTAICIGYAISPSSLTEGGFKKLIIFSEDDHGVLIPQDLMEEILTKDEKRLARQESSYNYDEYYNFPEDVKREIHLIARTKALAALRDLGFDIASPGEDEVTEVLILLTSSHMRDEIQKVLENKVFPKKKLGESKASEAFIKDEVSKALDQRFPSNLDTTDKVSKELDKGEFSKEDFSSPRKPDVRKLNPQTTLIITGHGLVPYDSEHNTLDHNLKYYLSCIESLPEELQKLIGESVLHNNAMD